MSVVGVPVTSRENPLFSSAGRDPKIDDFTNPPMNASPQGLNELMKFPLNSISQIAAPIGVTLVWWQHTHEHASTCPFTHATSAAYAGSCMRGSGFSSGAGGAG